MIANPPPLPAPEAHALVDAPLPGLLTRAAAVRDSAFGINQTWSPKVFLPLTQLCRDLCHA